MDTTNQNLDVEKEIVKSKKINCAGIGGSLGHPKVYLDMGDLNEKSSNLSLKTAPILSKFMYETDSDNPKIVWGRQALATSLRG